jgi:hypothetical protein
MIPFIEVSMIWQAIGEVSRDPSSQHERPIDRVRDSEQYFSSRQIEGSISILNFFPPNRGFDFYFEFLPAKIEGSISNFYFEFLPAKIEGSISAKSTPVTLRTKYLFR